MAAASRCLTLSGNQRVTVPAGSVPSSFLVKGKYIEFTVDAATFGVHDWTFTGVPNPLDITGGQRTTVFASKMPNHRGIVLNSGVSINSSRESLVLTRTGPGLSMKIQAKDCANGGVFQMEVERGDGTATVFTHVLADGVFYFDNPNVRDRLGENLPCSGILPDGTPVVCNGAIRTARDRNGTSEFRERIFQQIRRSRQSAGGNANRERLSQ